MNANDGVTPVCTLENDKPPAVVKAVKRRRARDAVESFDPMIKRLFPPACEEEMRGSDGAVLSQADSKEKEEEEVCECQALIPNIDGDLTPGEQIRQYFDLRIQPEDLTPRRKIRSTMNSAIRLVMFAVIDYVFKDALFHACSGCVYEEPGQAGHACLHWQSDYTNNILRNVAQKLSFPKILNIICVFAVSLGSLSLQEGHMLSAVGIRNTILHSEDPESALRKIIKSHDEKWLIK